MADNAIEYADISPSSSPPRTRAARRASRPRGASSGEGPPTGTSRRRGRPVRRSTTPCAPGGVPNHTLLQRVVGIELPVFVANGDSDPMILPRHSYLLAGRLPHVRLTIYPDAAHGFLFQHHSQLAADEHSFLQAATDAETRGTGL